MSEFNNHKRSFRATYGRAKEDREYNERYNSNSDFVTYGSHSSHRYNYGNSPATYAVQRRKVILKDLGNQMRATYGQSIETYAAEAGTTQSTFSKDCASGEIKNEKRLIAYVLVAKYLSASEKLNRLAEMRIALGYTGEDAIIRECINDGISDLNEYNRRIKEGLGINEDYFQVEK